MRLARLDLPRYGHFTNTSIELPGAERDIHIVFGPNEAGKTTCLTAIEDLLFGIPQRSPYNFLHSYENMRIGAVLEHDGDCFEFQRRKTRRDMILGPDGNPLRGDERLLAPFLGGADRVYFDRMFNLSHGRLAEGGRVIIEAKDDVGQMLFAAGTGLADLRERMRQLEEEADKLWAPRKSTQRLYYQARDRLDEARSRQRKCSLTVNAWRTARRTLSDAETTLQGIRNAYEATSKEQKKLVRIRRVHGAIRQRRELIQQIEALGNVIVLPEDAVEQLDQAKQQEDKTKAQVDILAPLLEKDRKARKAITFDEALVQRAEEITQLNELRIAVRSGRLDLPKRKDEYLLELRALARLAAEIGWDFEEPSELIERVPPRSKVEPVRGLLARHGELSVQLSSESKALRLSQEEVKDNIERLQEIGEVTDVSGLAAVLSAIRSIGDVAGRIRAAKGQVAEISQKIEKKLGRMMPTLPTDADIELLPVPPRDSITAHRDDARDWAHRLGETKQRLAEARNSRESDKKVLERLVHDEKVVARRAVEEARSYRDTLWSLVKTRYVARSEISAPEAQAYAEDLEDLPGSLEGAIDQADSIADQRFDKAKAAGECAVLARRIAGHETRIEQLESEEAALKAEGQQMERSWHTLWTQVPIEVLAPDVMLAWLEAREDVLTLIERQRDIQRQLTDSRQEEQEAIADVYAALIEAGWGTEEVETNRLLVMVEQADEYRRKQESKAEKIVEIRRAVRAARSDVARRQGELERAEADLKSWREEWAKTVAAIDLKYDEKPDVISAQINFIEEMRDHAMAARDLRDRRIATIEQDIRAFERTVADVAAELAPELTDSDAYAAVVELNRRRKEAQELYQQHRELSEAVAKRQREVQELNDERRAGWISIRPLMKDAGTEDVEELREAIVRSDRLRTLNAKLIGVTETLEQQGDELAIEVLEDECRDIDIDAARVKEEAVGAELIRLGERREEAAAVWTEARTAFDAIGGDDAAASAAADSQEALASMQDAAERYVRLRASAMLLRWAVDRYRTEKQGPLLKRAGELFRVLTRNSFERLEVAFDERDAMRLTGVRPNGAVVPMLGLSTGTEDQLFLALRIAAVEDYLERAVALPFVADDLFINFDPERSAAGFEVLGQLAERTQVLFYTHHPHLVDLAQETLGANVHVVTLDGVT